MGLLDPLRFRPPTPNEIMDRLTPVEALPRPPETSPLCTVCFKRPDGSIEAMGPVVFRYAIKQWEWPDGQPFTRKPTHWMYERH